MYCEDSKGKRVDLSSKEYASCSGKVCGGWRYVASGCAPWNRSCGGRAGAWLPAAEVCRLNLYAKFEKRAAASSSSTDSSSSSSSRAVGSKALIYLYPCSNDCFGSCCTEDGWHCCGDGLHCADSEGSCPQSSSVSGDGFTAFGTTILLSDHFEIGSSIQAFTGVTGGELVVPEGYNYAVFIAEDGSVREEYVTVGQVLIFSSVILLGQRGPSGEACDYCDCGAAEPCSWKDCGPAAPGYTNIFNCDSCQCNSVILSPTGNNSSSSSSGSQRFRIVSATVATQWDYGTITTVEVPTDDRTVDTEFYGSVSGGSDVVYIADTTGIISGMHFSVQGDCVDDEITSFTSEVILVERNQATLAQAVPGFGSCPAASISITGPAVPVFEFDGIEVMPDRVGPAVGHPDGYPDISAGQYQFFYDFRGASLRAARTPDSEFSEAVAIEGGSSSSSSSVRPDVFQFWDLTVTPQSPDGNPEFVTLAVTDAQLSKRIEIAALNKVASQCYYTKAEDECPDGYFENGFAQPCDGDCDKICCPDPDIVSNPMVCGRVYSGPGGHNAPWQFHLDPNTIRLSYKTFLTGESLFDLMPSEIESSLGFGLAEGSECCFTVRNSVRLMEVIGFDHCYGSLALNAERSYDDASETYVINASCEGDCDNLSGNYCLDEEIQAHRDEIQAFMDQAAQEFGNMDADGLITWLSENDSNLFERIGIDPDVEYTDEQIIETLLQYDVYSSTSSSSSSFEEVLNYRGVWDSSIQYMKNDVVDYGGNFYAATDDIIGEYAIGYGPENWFQCPDNSTVAITAEKCPGYSSFNPASFVEGWRLDMSRESYLPKTFDSASGSASENASSPTAIEMKGGKNYLISSVGGSKANTYFSFEIPQGRKITRISVSAISAEVESASVVVRSGAAWSSGAVVGESEFGFNLDADLLAQQLPLNAGQYSMRVGSSEAEFDYALVFVLE